MREVPCKNINKFLAFVILGFSAGFTGCGQLVRTVPAQRATHESGFEAPVETGKLENDALKEASGIASSKCQPDVYWTHNDSGDDATVYAINEKGDHLGKWKVEGATNRDWEDIAAIKDTDGKCSILIGDIGNNDADRDTLTIYKISEPDLSTGKSAEISKTAAAERLDLRYPDGTKNAEALVVSPDARSLYLVIKSRESASAVYKIKAEFGGGVQTAVKLTDLAVPAVPNGVVTGGDTSPDGNAVVLCDYFNGYEYRLPAGAEFDEIWKQKPQRIDIGKRKAGEAVTYKADGSALIAISETKNTPVMLTARKTK